MSVIGLGCLLHLMPQALQSSLRRVGPGRHIGVSTGRPVNRVSSIFIILQHGATLLNQLAEQQGRSTSMFAGFVGAKQ